MLMSLACGSRRVQPRYVAIELVEAQSARLHLLHHERRRHRLGDRRASVARRVRCCGALRCDIRDAPRIQHHHLAAITHAEGDTGNLPAHRLVANPSSCDLRSIGDLAWRDCHSRKTSAVARNDSRFYIPPATRSTVPVTYVASGPSSHAMATAISRGSAGRPRGTLPAARSSAIGRACGRMDLCQRDPRRDRIDPNAIARKLFGEPDGERIHPRFRGGVVHVLVCTPERRAADDTLTIAPPVPPRFVDISWAARREQRIVLSRLTSRTALIVATGVSARSPMCSVAPALFTRKRTGPRVSLATANSRVTSSSSVTSACAAMARAPASVRPRRLARPLPGPADSSPRRHDPTCARWSAVAAPMPLAAPVMTVTGL